MCGEQLFRAAGSPFSLPPYTRGEKNIWEELRTVPGSLINFFSSKNNAHLNWYIKLFRKWFFRSVRNLKSGSGRASSSRRSSSVQWRTPSDTSRPRTRNSSGKKFQQTLQLPHSDRKRAVTVSRNYTLTPSTILPRCYSSFQLLIYIFWSSYHLSES